MSLLDRVGAARAAGMTFAMNFWPWLLAAFLLGASVAGYGGFKVAKVFYQGQALKAERNLAQFDASLAKATAEGERSAAARQREAIDAINARKAAVDEVVAAIPGQVAAMLAPKFRQMGDVLNDPKFNCLRDPFPVDALRLLERPGGLAPTAGRSAGGAAGVGGLPDPAPR
jgi:hypothetical protein